MIYETQTGKDGAEPVWPEYAAEVEPTTAPFSDVEWILCTKDKDSSGASFCELYTDFTDWPTVPSLASSYKL